MKFTKMHGTGNDFIFLLDLDNKYIGQEESLAKKLCHRRFGIGADGVVLVRKSDIADIKMVIINSDGSWANMCGNAIRCFGKYVYERNIVSKDLISVETGDGVKKLNLTINNGTVDGVKVYMGEISFDGSLVPLKNKSQLINEEINVNGKKYNASALLVGVPHTVIFVDDENYDVSEGKYIEKFELFEEGTNVNFVKVVDDENIIVRTWERGAGATYSCGTGCSASVVVCNKLNLTKENLNDDFQDVDGLITDLKGVALVTSLADCQGILLYDPIKKIIGNIHSGWKGTLNKIIVNAIKLMEENFGCDPKNIEAYICPSILKCCFEVDKEVVDMFYENYNNIDDYVMKGDIKQGKQKYYIDTISINVNSMKELGLLEGNIHCSNICTKCHSDKYHSYRTDHDKSGRNIALICLK